MQQCFALLLNASSCCAVKTQIKSTAQLSVSSTICSDAKACNCASSQHGLVRSMQVFNTNIALMVPTADLANHSFQHNSVYALRASQGLFELTSSRAMKQGEAICITYGQDKTNAELMRDYGFFVPGNPHDRLDFAVSSWQQHAPVVAKPAQLLFKTLNGSAAPLTEEQRPQLLAGPFLKAVGLTGKVKPGKVRLCSADSVTLQCFLLGTSIRPLCCVTVSRATESLVLPPLPS